MSVVFSVSHRLPRRGTSSRQGAVDEDLDDLTFDDLRLLLDIGHVEEEELRGSDGRERRHGTKRLGDAHGERRLARARLASEQDGTDSNLPLANEMEDEAGVRAGSCPTMPSEASQASREESSPSPRMCDCAPMRSIRVRSRLSDSRLSSAMEPARASAATASGGLGFSLRGRGRRNGEV
jgi:hypothetical protein